MALELPKDFLPERIILRMLNTGVAAITPAILADILYTLSPEELEIVQAEWASRTPTVVQGFARKGGPFPCFALTLQSDSSQQDYVGFSEAALYDDEDVLQGNQFAQRTTATFTVWVYVEHPDLCVYYYRVLRRILNVGRRHLIMNELGEPTISGAEVAPADYLPENLFVRRLTLAVNYLEGWSDRDPLWEALNGEPEAFLSQEGELRVAHEDSAVVSGVLGGVHPTDDDEFP